MACEDSDYMHLCDHCCMLTETYSFCVETHLGGGVMGAFVFPSTAIAPLWCTVLRKSPWIFWLHCHDYHRALTLTCQNSPWWQSCECCNNFFVLIQATIAHSTHMIVTWHPLIGTSRKLTVFYWEPSKKTWVRAGGCKQSPSSHSQGQSKACCQECGCHSKE